MAAFRFSPALVLSRASRFSMPLWCALALMLVAPNTYAFKPGIHDNATRHQLSGAGFDQDSADEVADSNFYTDIAEPSSAAAHADNNQLGAASARLRTKRDSVATSLASCERRAALDAFGEALHTVQDIYSHSNAIDNNHSIPDLLAIADGTAACTAVGSAFAPGGLVTGYFSVGGYFSGNQCRGMPADMCCHRDLNKDDAGEQNGARFPAALAAARGATLRYLNIVKDHIRANYPNDAATQYIKMLEKKQRTQYFVIDDTGSMGNDIAGVQAAVNTYLDSLVASDEAPTLGLVSFKDAPTLYGNFCDVTAFRGVVNSLSAGGGDDCPEASNSGMLAALNQFPFAASDIQLKGGRLLLATDASAGDASLGPTVVATAQQRGVSIDAILTGDCVAETGVAVLRTDFMTSMNEPGHDAIATTAVVAAADDPLTSPSARTQLRALTAQTGGILFQVGRAEVEGIVPTLIEMGDPHSATLTMRRVVLAGGTPVVYDIPVDDTLTKKISFVVALSRAGALPTVTITRPNGSVVSPSDSDVERLRLSSVDRYAISAPAAGVWRVSISGNATIAFRAYGVSELDINALRFVNSAPVEVRPEVDFVPLDGQPMIGAAVTADLRLTSQPAITQVRVIRDDGSLLQSLAPVTTDARYFRVNFVVPNDTFFLEVVGNTVAGMPFVRQIAVPIMPQAVGISATPKSQSAAAGTNANYKVTIHNASAAATTYRLSAAASLEWSTMVPPLFSVAAGGSAVVDVGVSVPLGVAEGAVANIVLIVEDAAAPTTRNTTQVALSVVNNRAPSCDVAAASPASLWPPNHKMTSVAITGVTDPDGEEPVLRVTSITQDEPVDGKHDGRTAPDAVGVGTAAPNVRAERSSESNGRVYRIAFSASDGNGASCTGSVTVGVPKKQGRTAVDSGQRYDSTAIPPRPPTDDDDHDDDDNEEHDNEGLLNSFWKLLESAGIR